MAKTSGWSDYIKAGIRDHIFRTASLTKPSTLYVGLCTAFANTASNGYTEVSAAGYSRQAVPVADASWTVDSIDIGYITLVPRIQFSPALADWGTVSYTLLFDASSGGNEIAYGALPAPIFVANGTAPSFLSGTITLKVDS